MKYTYRIEWSEADHAHIARCLEFPSLAAHGSSPEKALKEIEFVVNESIRWMKEEGKLFRNLLGRDISAATCLLINNDNGRR